MTTRRSPTPADANAWTRAMLSQPPPAAWLGTAADWTDALLERGRYGKEFATMPVRPAVEQPTQLEMFG